jgi:hypothetical protein
MTLNELLLWLIFFHLRNKKLKEHSSIVYSHEEIRHIFRLEYTKQQKLIMPNISNKV